MVAIYAAVQKQALFLEVVVHCRLARIKQQQHEQRQQYVDIQCRRRISPACTANKNKQTNKIKWNVFQIKLSLICVCRFEFKKNYHSVFCNIRGQLWNCLKQPLKFWSLSLFFKTLSPQDGQIDCGLKKQAKGHFHVRRRSLLLQDTAYRFAGWDVILSVC